MARTNGFGSNASRATAETETTEQRSAQDSAALVSYIADMAGELAQLAGGAQMPMLAYFLNLARVEAEMQAREMGGLDIQRDN